MADPLNWKTRLEVTADGKVVSAIDSFTPTFNTQTTPIHSIEADNIGAIFHPQTATFTMTLKAIGPAVAELTKFSIDGALSQAALIPPPRRRPHSRNRRWVSRGRGRFGYGPAA